MMVRISAPSKNVSRGYDAVIGLQSVSQRLAGLSRQTAGRAENGRPERWLGRGGGAA